MSPPAVAWPAPSPRQAWAWLGAVALAWGGALAWPVAAPWLLALVLAPVLEEVVLRHGLQRRLRLRGWPAGACIAVCAALFALAHGLLRGPSLLAWATAVPALALGVLFERQRRLAPCVAGHALCNLIWLLGAPAA